MSMTGRISVPLSEMDEKFLQDLKEKYPGHTRLDIQVVNLEEIPSFNEDDFWGIIDLLDWSSKGTRMDVITPAVDSLAQHQISHIYLFEDILAEKLFLLDTKAHAKVAYPTGHFSEDGFLYIRAAVVASGKAKFLEVLQNPSLTPSEEDFEPILSLAAVAYEKKTKSSFDYIPATNYETYANEKGWE